MSSPNAMQWREHRRSASALSPRTRLLTAGNVVAYSCSPPVAGMALDIRVPRTSVSKSALANSGDCGSRFVFELKFALFGRGAFARPKSCAPIALYAGTSYEPGPGTLHLPMLQASATVLKRKRTNFKPKIDRAKLPNLACIFVPRANLSPRAAVEVSSAAGRTCPRRCRQSAQA